MLNKLGADRIGRGKMAKTVLLIEDEVNIIEALSFILSRDGWDVVTHSNGHDANEVITHGANLIWLCLM